MKSYLVAFMANSKDRYHSLYLMKAENFNGAVKKFRDKYPLVRIILCEEYDKTDKEGLIHGGGKI